MRNPGKMHGKRLFDLLADGREMTRQQIMDELQIGNRQSFAKAVRWLRKTLSDTADINLIVNRQIDGKWRYQLVETLEAAEPWGRNRSKSINTQVETIKMVIGTFPERQARIWKRGLSRILEDLADLEERSN